MNGINAAGGYACTRLRLEQFFAGLQEPLIQAPSSTLILAGFRDRLFITTTHAPALFRPPSRRPATRPLHLLRGAIGPVSPPPI